MIKRALIVGITAIALFAFAAPAAQAQEYPPPENGLIVSDTTVVPGQIITATAFTYAPGSEVGFTFFSHAVFLGSATADGDGFATTELQIPWDATPGQHALVASGIAPDGSELNVAAILTVLAVADGVTDGVPSDGVTGVGIRDVISTAPGVAAVGVDRVGVDRAAVTGELPRTGSESLPLLRIAAALMAVGGGLLFITRRRRAAAAS
jgi:LPXTG-motif cell wall-anchored protein